MTHNALVLVDFVLSLSAEVLGFTSFDGWSASELVEALRALGVLEADPAQAHAALSARLRERVEWVQAPADPGLELQVAEAGVTWSEAYDTSDERAAAAMAHQRAGRATLGIGPWTDEALSRWTADELFEVFA